MLSNNNLFDIRSPTVYFVKSFYVLFTRYASVYVSALIYNPFA